MKVQLLLLSALLLVVARALPNLEVASVSDHSQCKHPFSRLSTGCYYYSGDDKLTGNWFRASELCRRFGGHLVTIQDPAENNALKQFLLDKNVKGEVYVGGQDLGDHNNFYWQSNLEPLEYSDWLPGEPSLGSADYNCITLHPAYNFQWYSWKCTDNLTFFCEEHYTPDCFPN